MTPRDSGGTITKRVAQPGTGKPPGHDGGSDESGSGLAGSVAAGPGVLLAPCVTVRHARRDDPVAGLVYDAAPEAYGAATGSEQAARAAIEQLWRTPGHSASFEHALVAEIGGRVVGVLIGFPVHDRYRLHAALLRKGLRYAGVRRWPLLLAALPHLVAATPRPPRRAYYVGTIAVARHARRRDVASTLGHHAELVAQSQGFPFIVAHTGSRHLTARRALERYGLRPIKDRRWGYVLYVKPVDPAASVPREV
ncbi:GNAT family N-acetyltransferase [Mycolicibacterium hodleri]|nr:GNAT family N-acetyltransferase [Mycolicibacterium hodleri]